MSAVRTIFSLAVAALGMALSAAPASAQMLLNKNASADGRELLTLKSDPQARERPVVTRYFGVWLDGNKDGIIETAVADLNGDGTAEIFVRLISTATCDADKRVCRTIAIMHDGREWQAIFDRPASTVELGKPGRDKMRAIYVNGYEARAWNGRKYAIDLSGVKTTQVSFKETAGTRAVELARGFGNAAEKLVSAKRASVTQASTEIGGRQATFVRLDGDVSCGTYTGCPLRLLMPDESGRQIPILEATTRVDPNSAKPDVKIMQVTRGGFPSMVMTMPDGTPLVADWDGRRYTLEAR
jgi:hypothetical protein